MLTGTWFAPNVQKIMHNNVGFFAMPSNGGSTLIDNGSATPFGISAHSGHPAQAAAFLNFMVSPGHQAVPEERQLIHDPDLAKPDAFDRRLADERDRRGLHNVGQPAEEGFCAPVPRLVDASMLQTADGALQSLAAGKITPKAFVQAVQSDYSQYWQK